MIEEKMDASTMEMLERFHHECISLQPNEVVEYGKVLLEQGCAIDFTERCEDDDVGITGMAGKICESDKPPLKFKRTGRALSLLLLQGKLDLTWQIARVL
jgi:hypothetical protein